MQQKPCNTQQRQNLTSFGMGQITLLFRRQLQGICWLLLVRHQGTVTLLCHAARAQGELVTVKC